MTNWHVLLYLVAAVLALRSFVQLVTNYRSEFENAAVAKHLIKMAEELEADSQKAELAFRRCQNRCRSLGHWDPCPPSRRSHSDMVGRWTGHGLVGWTGNRKLPQAVTDQADDSMTREICRTRPWEAS